MPWGLNLGSPWKEAPFDFLIAMLGLFSKVILKKKRKKVYTYGT